MTYQLGKWALSIFIGVIGGALLACAVYFVFETPMVAVYASLVPLLFSVVVAAHI